MAPKPDPWLTDRLRADRVMVAAEKRIEDAFLAAIEQWLAAARALVLGQRPPHLNSGPDNIAAVVNASGITAGQRRYNNSLLVADGADFTLDLDAVQASFGVWQEALQQHVEPAISEAFTTGFGGAARSADISPLPYMERHIRDVHDRLKIWPESAWEDMRPELQQIISRSGTTEEAANQVAGILGINAPTRKLREQITAVDEKIAATDDKFALRALRAQRRQLWEQHDRSLGEWQWLARRIARTEVQGAVEGGQLAHAEAIQHATGQEMFKQWLATSDARCRRTHRIADGQIVPLSEKFQVGRARLKHPAQPGGPAHEVIQCRCTMRILSADEVAAALKSEWGRRGVQPMSARMGPDDESAVDMAHDLLRREDAGETVQWPDKEPDPEPPPPEPEPVAAPPKRKARPEDEFRGKSMDDLERMMNDAAEREDWDLLDRLAGEEERRTAKAAAAKAQRAAQREAKEAAQMSRYEELVAAGVDDEEAVAEAFGISIDKQRRMNAISWLRGMGYQGNGLDDLVKAWHRDQSYQAWLDAEDSTNGYMLSKAGESAGTDPRKLWMMSETQATRYASEELRAWWDEHGRVTVAELKAQLLDQAELARMQSARRDYLQ